MKAIYKKLSLVLLLTSIISTKILFSQVLITDDGTTSPDASAMLEIKSTDKGMLIPRLTTTQRTTLSSTAVQGLLVFDTNFGSFFIYGKTAEGTNGWIDLSTDAGIWTKNDTCVFLSNPKYNVGIGTNTPNRKFVLKAENDNDTLFEIQDKDGKPLMLITPTLTKFYFNESNKKGIAGGFAVGRYATAKATTDTALFIVTPDSTRVYTSGLASTVEAGGFAVGRYATAKGSPIKFFNTNIHNTRVYTDGDAKKGIAGGFAVGRYATAKGENTHKYFYADIDSTRIYTDGSGTKGIAGGFAVGRYATAKTGGKGNYMYMKPDNYFIGDSSGLHIQQDINLIGKYNTFFGYKTGMINEIGGNNVFIGYKSGFKNTGIIVGTDTLGSRNVFLGYEAGINNDRGSDNVLLGYKAGHEIIMAGNNINIGSEAGFYNTNNSDNIFLGRKAGYNHTGDGTQNSANNNIYIGLEAGYGNTTGESGYDNVFFGTKSGYNNTSGHSNVFIGNKSGYNNKTAISNVFIGNCAGYSNEGNATSYAGVSNVIIGDSAGYSNVNGYTNVFIGFNSGKKNIDGYSNVFLGYESGLKNNGSKNLFLGYNSGKNIENSTGNTFLGINAGVFAIGGNNNIFIGPSSGSYQESGDNNIYLGEDAGAGQNSNTPNEGHENVFIGTKSGEKNEKGSYNVFLGYYAGANNKGYSASGTDYGYDNVFLGYQAGLTNETGHVNVYIGKNSGRDNVDQFGNTFLGAYAGEENIKGGNTFLGLNAGRYGRRRFQEANTGGGGENTFIGYNSGEYSTGDHNTTLGFSCGVGLGDGENNVYIGDAAGYKTYDYNTGVSGSNNVYLGQHAGGTYFNGGNTGSNNVYLGQNSGGGPDVSGSGNIFIGKDAGSNESSSNLLYIENSASSTPLIWGDFDNDIVKIYSHLNINDSYTFPTGDGGTNFVLKTDGSGTLSWTNVNTLVTGDNLGNHLATQDLDMNTNNITKVNTINFRATDGDLGSLQYTTSDRWEFNNGSFYITSTCPTTYIYSNNIYLGAPSGDIIYTRDNQFQTRYIRAYSSNGLNFQTDEGTTRMFVNDDGRVGIGTTSPATNTKLHVVETAGTTPTINAGTVGLFQQNSASGNWASVAILSGTSGRSTLDFGDANDQDIGSIDYSNSDNSMRFITNTSEKMRINSSGNIGIGTTSPDYKLQVNGTIAPETDNSFNLGSSTRRWRNVYATNGTIQTSDKRLKENIKPLKYGLTEIMELKPVSFTWIDNPNKKLKLGLIAQDVKLIIDEAVYQDEENKTDLLGINYSDIIPVLIKGMQEQQKQIEKQQKQIQELKQLIQNK